MPITYAKDAYTGSPITYVELNGRRIAHYQGSGSEFILRWYHMGWRMKGSTVPFPSLDALQAACEAFERGLDIEPWSE